MGYGYGYRKQPKIIGGGGGPAIRLYDVMIAASNSPAWAKACADVVCPGTNDHVVINNELSKSGVRSAYFFPGLFSLGNSILPFLNDDFYHQYHSTENGEGNWVDIVVKAGVTPVLRLSGSGLNTIFRLQGQVNAPAFMFAGDGNITTPDGDYRNLNAHQSIIMEDFTIDGNKDNQDYSFTESIDAPFMGEDIAAITFRASGMSGDTYDSDQSGMVIMRNIRIVNCKWYTISCWGETSIYDCQFDNCDHGIVGKFIRGIAVEQCIFYHSPGVLATSGSSARITGNRAYGVSSDYSDHMTITPPLYFAHISNTGATSIISDNYIDGFANGIYCINGANATISGNKMFNIRETAVRNAWGVGSVITGNVIDYDEMDSNFLPSNTGIHLSGVGKAIISGNRVNTTKTALQLEYGCGESVVTGNHLKGGSADPATYCDITLLNTDLLIHGNYVSGDIRESGPGTNVIKDNVIVGQLVLAKGSSTITDQVL